MFQKYTFLICAVVFFINHIYSLENKHDGLYSNNKRLSHKAIMQNKKKQAQLIFLLLSLAKRYNVERDEIFEQYERLSTQILFPNL